MTATVVFVSGHSEGRCESHDQQRRFYVSDGRSYSPLSQALEEQSFPKSGELVRFDGRLMRERFGWNNARIERFHRIGTARVPKPEEMTVADLQNPSNLFRYASMAGTLTDVVRDDIDPENTWLFLRGTDGSFLALVASGRLRDPSSPALGDSIELVGCCRSSPTGGRRHFQPAYLNALSVRIHEKAPSDPFAVPGIGDLDYISPYLLDRLSLRCTAGLVLAVLQQNRILLRTPEGRVVGAEMRESRLPLLFAAVGFSIAFFAALLIVAIRARVVKTRARLKALERTRLAAEIHDSLSQNLSGVAGQIAAVRRAMAVNPSVAVDYLVRAERMLSSSRTELQRCLFDLRGNALEAADLNEAVRQTVGPLLGTVRLWLSPTAPRPRLIFCEKDWFDSNGECGRNLHLSIF